MSVVAVTGGRSYFDRTFVDKVLDHVHSHTPIGVLVHGGATGADSVAKGWADRNGILTADFKISKGVWDKLGKAAGTIRNEVMLRTTRPILLIAFPGERGTSRCVGSASKLGIDILDCRSGSFDEYAWKVANA